MKKGSLIYFPIGFVLCLFMVSIYWYFSTPSLGEQEVEEWEAVVLACNDDRLEAAVYRSEDTLYYSNHWQGHFKIKPMAGQRIVLYTAKSARTLYGWQQIQIMRTLRIKAGWIALSTGIILSIGIGYLLLRRKRTQQHGKTR